MKYNMFLGASPSDAPWRCPWSPEPPLENFCSVPETPWLSLQSWQQSNASVLQSFFKKQNDLRSSQWLDWNNNLHNTRPRLIVISHAIGYKRIPKCISSGWDVFKSLSVAQTVCHWWISFFRQQIVQARCFAQHTAPIWKRRRLKACPDWRLLG